jgi:hypothetical protein
MNRFVTFLVAALALAMVALVPGVATAGHGGGHGGGGWHGGGHWHGGGGWHGGAHWHDGGHWNRGWGYRGWRGYGGWWGPGVGIYVWPGYYGRRCWSPAWGYYRCGYRYGY